MQLNSDIDFEVVKKVFNLDPNAFKWGVPFFSTSNDAAAMVNTEMALMKGPEIKAKYEAELERLALSRGWKSKPECTGLSIFLMLSYSQIICEAAIKVCHEHEI